MEDHWSSVGYGRTFGPLSRIQGQLLIYEIQRFCNWLPLISGPFLNQKTREGRLAKQRKPTKQPMPKSIGRD